VAGLFRSDRAERRRQGTDRRTREQSRELTSAFASGQESVKGAKRRSESRSDGERRKPSRRGSVPDRTPPVRADRPSVVLAESWPRSSCSRQTI
jgi:hypothetical protein